MKRNGTMIYDVDNEERRERVKMHAREKGIRLGSEILLVSLPRGKRD